MEFFICLQSKCTGSVILRAHNPNKSNQTGFIKMCVNVKWPLAMLAMTALVGCGGEDKNTGANNKNPSQVAARVNDTELTVHQINYALQRIPNLSSTQAQDASRRIVRNLVDQELIAQKALDEKLERDPSVIQAMEAARRQILVETYMSRKLGAPAKPTESEVTDYFTKHPELFARRKIYRLQEISIKAPEARHEAISKQLAVSKSISQFGEWLKAENIPASAAQAVKPAEQLPLTLLPKLAEMPQGQAMVVRSSDGLQVILLVEAKLQPVTTEQAKGAIEKILQTQARQKAAQAELDTLRASAKIEYFGEFKDAGKVVVGSETKNDQRPTGVKPATSAEALENSAAISKGISGL
jgi:EpsD family peptidyl-prolyl cis-trans isomerase